jgi:hypothetical protein
LGKAGKSTRYVKQDMNFLEYPLWFQDERLPEGFVWKDRDGFVYRAGYKPPTRLDGLYLMYWMLSSQQAGWAEHVYVTQRNNMSSCGVYPNKSKALRLQDSCERWINVTVKFKGTFYDGKRYENLQFNIINEWWIDKMTKHLHVDFNKIWLEKVKHSNFFKLIDFDDVRRLRSPRAARLYELLVKNFQGRNKWVIDAHKLAHKYPMTRKYVSQIIRDVKAALADITRRTSLQVGMSVENNERGKAMLYFEKLAEKEIAPEAPDRTLESEIPSGVKDLVGLLNEKHRRQKAVIEVIRRALVKHDSDYIKRNILYSNEQAKKNYKAFLSKAIEDDWGLGWQDDRKPVEMNHQPPFLQEDDDQIELERKLRHRARGYIEELDNDEREQLKHHALRELEAGMRKKVETGDYFANVCLRRKMESLVMRNELGPENMRVGRQKIV